MPTKTRWGVVLVLILAGMIAALQIGKAAIAAPVLQRELGLTLVTASWIIGAYGVLGAFGGLPAGVVASLFSARRTLLLGLAAAGAASLAGAFTESGTSLLATRVIEGCGFLAAVIAIPRLLRSVTAPKDVETVLALWGAYMPAGSVAMMLASPLLLPYGWQTLWLVNGVVALLCALTLARTDFNEHAVVPIAGRDVLSNLRAVIATPGPVLLALLFGVYTFQYGALTGLLPTLLIQQLGLSIAAAGLISAVTVAANAVGNLAAGALVRIGVPLWAIAAAAFVFVGAAAFGIFSPSLPVALIALLASVSLALSGLIPASIFAAAPKFAPTSAMLAIALGLFNQASNIGNLVGPAALAAFVESYGWASAPFVFVGVMGAGLVLALLLRLVLHRRVP